MNDAPSGGSAVESASRRASFLRVLRVMAMTVVVLVGVRLAAPVLKPVFFAVVLSLFFGQPDVIGRDGISRCQSGRPGI